MKVKLVFIFCALCLTAFGADFFEQYNSQTGIVYKTVNGESLDLALIRPETKPAGGSPLMVYIHGGGWVSHDKTVLFWPDFRRVLDQLLKEGIACATIEYRLNRVGVSTAYDSVVDCKDAVRFLVKHAGEFGIDPSRIGVWGGSAGGHLTLMTALVPDENFPGAPELAGIPPAQFKCAVAYFPATTFMHPEIYTNSNFRGMGKWMSFLGSPPEDNPDMVKLLSPAEHLTPDSPPVFLLHGDQDEVLSYKNSVYMKAAGDRIGADVQLLTVTNGLHGFRGENISPAKTEIEKQVAFFIIDRL